MPQGDKGQSLLLGSQSPNRWGQGDRQVNSQDDSARGRQEDKGDINLNHEGLGRQGEGGGIPGTNGEGHLQTRRAGGPRH